MNKEYIHKDTRTDEPLQAQIEILTRWQDPTIKEMKKEIERLTAESTEWESKCYKYQNIINELEKYIKEEMSTEYEDMYGAYENVLDKLKELKEGK